MQIENDSDKEVYNGDIGYINAVDPDARSLLTAGKSATISAISAARFRLMPRRFTRVKAQNIRR
jgi:ATP-dependent exoDNAse (exonuclease V) alpha subunit